MLENMITDRTATDVQRWRNLRDKGIAKMTPEELAEWKTGMKGAYNTSDLNRVGAALLFLRTELVKCGYLLGTEFEPKTDWEENDVPTLRDFLDYTNAVDVVRNALAQYKTTPETPPFMQGLTFQGANDIEQILLDIDELLTKTNASPLFCGELFTGEI